MREGYIWQAGFWRGALGPNVNALQRVQASFVAFWKPSSSVPPSIVGSFVRVSGTDSGYFLALFTGRLTGEGEQFFNGRDILK